MIMWQELILGYLSIVTISAACASDVTERPFGGSFLYENAERTALFAYRNGYLEVGAILPNKPLGDQKSEFTEFLGSPTRDCSDAHYRCVAADQNVLAIPRKQLSLAMTYTVVGTIFTVEECIRGVGNKCQVALIKGDCQFVQLAENLRECAPYPDGRAKSPQQGGVYYFIYNEDYGITSLGIVDDEVHSKSEMMAVAKTYVLQGNVGLLAP